MKSNETSFLDTSNPALSGRSITDHRFTTVCSTQPHPDHPGESIPKTAPLTLLERHAVLEPLHAQVGVSDGDEARLEVQRLSLDESHVAHRLREHGGLRGALLGVSSWPRLLLQVAQLVQSLLVQRALVDGALGCGRWGGVMKGRVRDVGDNNVTSNAGKLTGL